MNRKVLRSNPAPLYLQVAETLRQRIRKGQWKEGDILPSLDALMAEFGVAKVTVRQAVKLLEDERLLAPQRGRGTTVLKPPKTRRHLQVQTTLSDLIAMYSGDKPDVQHLEDTLTTLPDDAIVDASNRETQSSEEMGWAAPVYHQIRRTHARDGERYCVIDLYIENALFTANEARFRNELALNVLATTPGVEIIRARQSMTISKCDIETADLLGLAIGDPVAEVRRTLFDGTGQIVYLADVVYRGDYVRLDMDLRP